MGSKAAGETSYAVLSLDDRGHKMVSSLNQLYHSPFHVKQLIPALEVLAVLSKINFNI
jgi:hypothetical protein